MRAVVSLLCYRLRLLKVEQRVIGLLRSLLFLLVVGVAPAGAEDPGTLNPEPLPPLQNPNSPMTPAKELFALTPRPGSRRRGRSCAVPVWPWQHP